MAAAVALVWLPGCSFRFVWDPAPPAEKSLRLRASGAAVLFIDNLGVGMATGMRTPSSSTAPFYDDCVPLFPATFLRSLDFSFPWSRLACADRQPRRRISLVSAISNGEVRVATQASASTIVRWDPRIYGVVAEPQREVCHAVYAARARTRSSSQRGSGSCTAGGPGRTGANDIGSLVLGAICGR